MRTLLAILAVTFAIPDRPERAPKVARPPHEQIFGDWYSAGINLESPPKRQQPGYIFRITPSESFWIENFKLRPENGLTARITVDWSKTPATIDFAPRRGGTPLLGIVRVEGELLILAWSDSQNRPTDFVMPHNIHYFKRVRP
jgi:uncharacterized protein (TIGR03067 family)